MDPIEQFKARLQTITPADPLWAGLMYYLDELHKTEERSLCLPAIGDGEAHRGRGRLGMLIDLRDQLDDLMVKAHATPQ